MAETKTEQRQREKEREKEKEKEKEKQRERERETPPRHNPLDQYCWAEAPIKIARMTLTIKLDGNWNSFQLANSAPPLSVTDSAIAPSARMERLSSSKNS